MCQVPVKIYPIKDNLIIFTVDNFFKILYNNGAHFDSEVNCCEGFLGEKTSIKYGNLNISFQTQGNILRRTYYPYFARFEAYLPDVEVKTDLLGFSSGRSLSIAQRLDEICS